jgi:hypothetical protein
MRITLTVILLALTFYGSVTIGRTENIQQNINSAALQTVTLYPPHDKTSGKFDDTKACFSFKLGRYKLPDSADWDLGYGFVSISNEDWFRVGTIS